MSSLSCVTGVLDWVTSAWQTQMCVSRMLPCSTATLPVLLLLLLLSLLLLLLQTLENAVFFSSTPNAGEQLIWE